MLSSIILILLSAIVLFVGYQALRHKRTYWFAPTIVGFKDRKKEDSKSTSILVGVLMIFLGCFLLILFFISFFKYLRAHLGI